MFRASSGGFGVLFWILGGWCWCLWFERMFVGIGVLEGIF